MKTLPLEFEQAADGLKKQRFKQVRREGNITIYERRHLDGRLFGYEVFTVKCKVFPGQTEPQEAYPKSRSFGKTAWFSVSLERAEKRFKALTEEVA